MDVASFGGVRLSFRGMVAFGCGFFGLLPAPARAQSAVPTPPALGAAGAPAAGETLAGASAPMNGAPDPASSAVVVLALRDDELPRDRLLSGLKAEIAEPIVLEPEVNGRRVRGVLTMSYARARSELAVTWDSAGHTLSRIITTSSDPNEAVVDGVMLAGNLTHDQTEDLLPPKTSAPATLTAAAPVARASAPAERAPERLLATASLFYPLATHYDLPEATSHFDFNLMFGRVGAIEGAQLGVVNVVSREGKTPARLQGLQTGVLANIVAGNAAGLQLASLANLTRGNTSGLQVAFGVNVTGNDFQGLQAAGLLNRASRVEGAQVSLLNMAGEIDGLQLGLVNIAHNVRGVSVGLINVADDVDGLPIAPISVTRSGGIHPTLWSSTSGFGNAGVKFATRSTYTVFYCSYHRAFSDEFVGGGLAVGGRIRLGGRFHADVDVSGTWMIAPEVDEDSVSGQRYHQQLVQPRLRMLVGYRFADHLGLFAGGAATGQIRSELDWDRVTGFVGPEFVMGVEL